MPALPRTVTEPSREIDVIHETDVLVVGSGPGGLAAAVAAARAGVDVALVERFGCFGGNITTVGVEGFAWYRHEQTVEAGGIGWEFEQRAKAMAASVMFHLAGVDKALFLKGVAEDPQTYRDWTAGEFAADTDEKDADRYSPYLGKPFAKAIADGVLPADLNTIGGTWGAMHDTGELTYMNLVHLQGCDGTDPDSLTRFEIEGRKQAMLAIEVLRRYTPGCTAARLRNFGMTIGVRDTRKIDAVYNLTATDTREQGRFHDSIGIYPEFIDGYGVLVLPTTGRYLQIPYRSLLPKAVRHLVVAGRATGGDRIAHAATRNMSCCAVTGQGAGVAAALSIRTDRSLGDVNTSAMQAELVRQDVRIA